jgi:hypothetical protein
MLERKQRKATTLVTFVVPAEHPCGPVSVVGDFNDWQPGTHTLVERSDGSRAVTVTLPVKDRVAFRYLAHGDYWFNDDHADAHDGTNGVLFT